MSSRSTSSKSKLSTRAPTTKSKVSAVSKKSVESDASDDDNESDTGRASRISKYSKYSKLSKQNSKADSGSDEYYDEDDDVSLKSAATKAKSGVSRRLNTGGSTGSNNSSVYQASRKNSGARTVADSKDTKVNTPVDLKSASEVSDSDEYYSDEYSGSDDEKKKSAVSRK